MPTIAEDGFFTLIIEFEVEPTQQQELIDAIANEVEKSFRQHPGFVSASFHASHDGWRVVNYAQWSSEEAYQDFLASAQDSGQAAIGEEIRRLGAKPLRGHSPYQVRRVIEG